MTEMLDSGLGSFGLSAEHVMLRDTVRRLVEKELQPLIEAGEAGRYFPTEILTILAAHDLIGLKYPVEEGGQGGDLLSECIFIEEIARGAAGASASVFAHSHLAIAPLVHFGSAELKEQFVRPALRGEIIGGFALTEPDAGSDVKGIRTRAERVGGAYRLQGQKMYITNGSIADYLVVAAYTQPGAGADGISLFAVPTSSPGLSARPMHKLGNWSSNTAEVFFDEVVVPEENRIGPEHGGFRQLMHTLTEGRIIVATRGLAIASRAVEVAKAYAEQRHAFGKPIGSYQAISHKIARLTVELDAARLLINRAAALSMAGADASIEASKAKLFASELAQRATTEALHVHGGAGYTPEFPVERLYRDAPESVIGEGTAEIQLRVISRSLGLGGG